jgi:hypothetical protein
MYGINVNIIVSSSKLASPSKFPHPSSVDHVTIMCVYARLLLMLV